ncbi:TadE/TadG family type IV pilus assembly protein, partial [Azospirillum sp.]|uniref:TadE/TadG family type IV pilus assembly protein n=1 Tax=Azospirillum sp. TaxID=34012 RepID=UPI002D4DD520
MMRRRLLRDERGSVLIEFALVLPLFFAVLVAIIETATFFWTRNTLQFAAEEAARLSMVNTATTPAAIKTAVNARLTTISLDPARLTVTAVLDPFGGVKFMKVTARYAWPAGGITGLLPVALGDAVGEARVPMVQ